MTDRPAALIRASADDFRVIELPKVEPDGAGEHLLVYVRKRDANTPWVAGELARWAGVPARAVSWAGLKDRRAVTEQWFSIHQPKVTPEVAAFASPGVEIVELHRHSRKLQRGALNGNRFVLVLRELSIDATELAARAARLVHGVPNRFGPQRFGRGNLERARHWFKTGRAPRDRTQRAMAVSAARSALFNAVLDARVARGDWAMPLAGDIMMLDRRGARFAADAVDDEIVARCAAGEIHPTGPLWGAGGTEAGGEAGELERAVAAQHAELADGLERVARPDRRPLRVVPHGLHTRVVTTDTLELSFELPPGAYATSVLDELVAWRVPADDKGEIDAGDD